MADKYHSDAALNDTPVDAELGKGITSNWAHDHAAAFDAHIINPLAYTGPERWRWSMDSVARVLAGDTLAATPMIVPCQMSFDRIGIRVSTLEEGKSARMGIYRDNGSSYPGERVIDAGEVSIATTGYKLINIDVTLEKGLYWLVINTDATGTAAAHKNIMDVEAVMGARGEFPACGPYCWGKTSEAYGALPDPYPAGAADLSYKQGWVGVRRKA